MKTLGIAFIFTCISCTQRGTTFKLKYPEKAEDISGVTLIRPDKKSDGKFAEIKELSVKEISQLLLALKEATPLGPGIFIPDYYIHFTTKRSNKNVKIKVQGNKIKQYDNDFAFQMKDIDFLLNF